MSLSLCLLYSQICRNLPNPSEGWPSPEAAATAAQGLSTAAEGAIQGAARQASPSRKIQMVLNFSPLHMQPFLPRQPQFPRLTTTTAALSPAGFPRPRPQPDGGHQLDRQLQPSLGSLQNGRAVAEEEA